MKLWQVRTPNDEPAGWMFWCPGCESYHVFDRRWSFDGDLGRPTFDPSLAVTYPDGRKCHLFLRQGRLQFLADSYHALAGQTVDLPEDPADRDGPPEAA